MNLYRSKGHIWTGTQADAKAANDGDKNFEHIDVPTDKAGLIAFLNAMEERTQAAVEPVYMTPEEVMEPSEILSEMPFEPTDEPLVYTRKAPAPVAADCPACLRTKKQAKIAADCAASISIKADLEDIGDEATISNIIALAEERKAQIIEEARQDFLAMPE